MDFVGSSVLGESINKKRVKHLHSSLRGILSGLSCVVG